MSMFNDISCGTKENVVIPSGVFQYIYHIGCGFNLHSRINTWRSEFLHNAWKRHQDAVFWVDINLAIRKGLTFCQTRSNAIILQGILPAYCIPKVVRLKTGEVFFRESIHVTSTTTKDEWTKELGSKVVQQPEGETVRQPVVRQTKFFQSTQPSPNPIRDRLGRLDDMKDERKRPVLKRSMFILFTKNSVLQIEQGDLLLTHTAAAQDDSQVYHEANTLNIDDEVLRKRMEKSIVVHDENHEPMMVNEADMDFRIPGLPHSVVKHAQSTSVRELIQKIENHPNRHALQQDLRQSQSLNPFSPESKQMIRDVGNIELCELLETEPVNATPKMP